MKKQNKTDKFPPFKLPAISRKAFGITLAVLFVFSFVAGYSAYADFSLKSAIANVAGKILGEKLANDISIDGEDLLVGGSPGPDNYNLEYWGINGVDTYYFTQNIRTGTNTPCMFRTPSATSTLDHLTTHFDIGSSTALTMEFATSTKRNATTTAMYQGITVPASSAYTYWWAPTTTDKAVMGPNLWLNVGIRAGDVGGSYTGLTPSGDCQVKFEVIER